MRVLIMTDSYPPEIRSASHLMLELSEDLAKLGHEVTVLTCLPRYNLTEMPQKYRRKFFIREDVNDITVIRVAPPPIHQVGPILRSIGQISLPFIFLLAGLLAKRQDILITYSPPLTLGLSSYFLGKRWKAPFIFNAQDIFPQNVIDLGILRNKLIIMSLRRLEKFIYKEAQFITVHSKGNRDYILSGLKDPDKVVVIPNWVDTDVLRPANRYNRFRKDNGLEKNFVVLFAGVMGYAQDLETVIEAANLLRDNENILFLLVGEGVEKEKLVKKAVALNLDNVRFLPFVSREDYPELLSASDCCLVTLKKAMQTPVVPGKLLGIMAGGRPVVASLPLDGDAPEIIKEAGCGYCLEPEEPELLSQAILRLYENPSMAEELGSNGREYAQRHFSRRLCTEKYNALIEQACEG